MRKKPSVVLLLCGFAFLGQMRAQQVFVDRDNAVRLAAHPEKEGVAQHPAVSDGVTRRTFPKALPVLRPDSKMSAAAHPAQDRKVAMVLKSSAASAQPAKPRPLLVRASKPAAAHSVSAQKMRLTRVAPPAPEPSRRLPFQAQQSGPRAIDAPIETAFTKLADGFDFPVGKPDAQGYYKARGFRAHGHLGEDWDGIRGGDSDLRDPIYSIGNGIVVFARDCHMGWGNVIIVRHVYREHGQLKNIDALYGHLDRILVRRGQRVARGEQIGTMGTAHGLYDAHLHLEIRKNIEIGMSRAAFARDYSNYYDPSQFIASHRHLQARGSYRVAMNTFIRDSKINFAASRNYSRSHYRGGSRESAAALKRAMAAKNSDVVRR